MSGGPSLKEYLCPICYELSIKPVRLPCTHEFCMECYEQNLQSVGHSCPFCRKRFAVWARRHKNTDSLVNKPKWDYIQTHFAKEIQKLDSSIVSETLSVDNDDYSFVYTIQEPGKIGKEWEEMRKKLLEEEEAQRLLEEEKSRKFIEQMLQMETVGDRQSVESSRIQKCLKEKKKQELEDRKLAIKLSEELNTDKNRPADKRRSYFFRNKRRKVD